MNERRIKDRRLPNVLKVDEVARLLRLDRKTVYALVNDGEIPGARKLRGAIRISRDAVLDWLRQGSVPHARRKK